MHLIDGNPNARRRLPINSRPNIIVIVQSCLLHIMCFLGRASEQILKIAMVAFFCFPPHRVSSCRQLHLIDGSPNARGQPPINSRAAPTSLTFFKNIIVSHFSKRAPFDLVSPPCTCWQFRLIVRLRIVDNKDRLPMENRIIPNKSSSYRPTRQIYGNLQSLPMLNQCFQGKEVEQILCENRKE